MFSGHGDVKIIDFGLALDLRGHFRHRFDRVGSPSWMAPEIIKSKAQTTGVDIWGLGLILLSLANGGIPHDDDGLSGIMSTALGERKKLSEPEKWSENMNHFIHKCLRDDPASRGTAEQLLEVSHSTQPNTLAY
jgi:serine/threonine protein kinase